MGQKLQCYIKIHNPLKNKEVVESLNKSNAVLSHAKAVFKNSKYSILAFHHQWLYGATAAAICINILRKLEGIENPYHILSKNREAFPYPKYYTSDEDNVDGFIQTVQALFFQQFDVEMCNHNARYGVESTISLCMSSCSKDFRDGDNNDGIMIIDAVEKKYCFMNIFNGQNKRRKTPPRRPSRIRCTLARASSLAARPRR